MLSGLNFNSFHSNITCNSYFLTVLFITEKELALNQVKIGLNTDNPIFS